MPDTRRMAFKRFGRSYHLRIETAEDLADVLELDEAHWVATGAPINTMNCDPTFLDLVDSDDNGRIMCFEVTDAVRWVLNTLRDLRGVTSASTALKLDSVNGDDEQGARVHQAASKMLDRLGLSGTGQITLDQIRRIQADEQSAAVSEAGVIVPDASDEEDVREFIRDIIATVGAAAHPSGVDGIGRAQLDQFIEQARAYLRWRALGEFTEGQTESAVMPLGSATGDAFQIYASLRSKIDQYFAQCEAVALDPRAAQWIGLSDAEFGSVDFDDPGAIDQFIKTSPLAQLRSDHVLSLDENINSRYAPQLAKFRTQVIEPVLGETSPALSERQWQQIKQLFNPHEEWLNAKPGAAVENIGVDTLSKYTNGSFAETVGALIAESAATVLEMDNIRLAEKLILYQAYMLDLVNNFVSFPDLYHAQRRAMFEMGTFIADERHFNLCVRVEDRTRHTAVARASSIFVLYVEVRPRGGDKTYEVAVPVTSGGKGNLCVGKRGLFVDLGGHEYDAQVVQIIENPISISEALVSPFKRLGRVLTGKIEAMTSTAEKTLDATASTAVSQLQTQPESTAAAKPSTGLLAGGVLMGGGVALAAISSAIAFIVSKFKGVATYKIVIGVVVAIAAVMLPTLVVAFAKLRKRDLSAILEGSGWAINARMRLTGRQGRTFTRTPAYPRGARGLARRRLWCIVLAVLLVAGLAFGWHSSKQSKAASDEPSATTRKAT